MIIAVASGKGGTGKTTVAVNLAAVAVHRRPVQLLDLDVEEPNAHIFLRPSFKWQEQVHKKIPQFDYQRCTFCGRCEEVCNFNSLVVLKEEVLIFPDMCHSCGACVMLCPERAVSEIGQNIGEISGGPAWAGIELVQGQLDIGHVDSPALIKAVKKYIRAGTLTILDAPPGAACSVAEALKGVNYCLLVAEDTPFGLSDLELTVSLVRSMGIPFGLIVNRWAGNNSLLEGYADEQGIPVLLKLPFDRDAARIYAEGGLLVHHLPFYRQAFEDLLLKLGEVVEP